MMATAGSIVVDLLARTGSFETDMKRAARVTSDAGKSFTDIVGKAKLMAIGLAGAAATAGAAVVHEMLQLSERMDATSKAARGLGVGIETLQAMQYEAEKAGVSSEDLSKALTRLSTSAYSAMTGTKTTADAFKMMGISVRDSAGNLKSTEQLWKESADWFARTQDSSAKAGIAYQVFGKNVATLTPLLNEGSKGLEEATAKARELGIIFSQDTADAAEQLNDDLTDLGKRWDGLKVKVGTQLIPAMADFVRMLSEGDKSTNDLQKSTKDLASDSSLGDWIDIVGSGLAHLVDVLVMIGKLIKAVTGSFKVVTADVQNFAAQMSVDNTGIVKLINPDLDAKNKAAAAAAQKSRDDALAQADADWSDLLTYDGAHYANAWRTMSDARRSGAGRAPSAPNAPQLAPPPVLDLSKSGQLSELQKLIKKLQEENETLGMTKEAAERHRIETLKGSEADRTRALSLYDQNVAFKENKKAMDEAAESARIYAAHQHELDVFSAKKSLDIIGIGVGDSVKEQMAEELDVRQKYAEDRRKLEEDQQKESTKLTQAAFDARLQMLGEFEDAQIQIIQDKAAEKAAAEADWTNGARKAIQDYYDQSSNFAGMTNDLFTNAFKGMEDSLVEFVTTGKLNFADFAKSIVADLTRMWVKMMIMKPLMNMFGGFFGGVQGLDVASAIQGGGGDGIGALISLNGWADGGWTGPGAKDEIAGFVHKDEFVLNKEATARAGVGFLTRLNQGYSAEPAATVPASSGPRGRDVNVTFVLGSQVQVDDFKASQRQIESRMAQAARRASVV
jgi:lambda family phage tail tape measure protein